MNIPEYLEKLNWRYATKQFDLNKKLDEEQLQFIKDVLRLSPSSVGIQPWKFIIVTDPVICQKLREKAYGQPQFTDASAIVIFCSLKELNQNHITKVIASTSDIRQQSVESLQGYQEMMMGLLKSKNPEQLREWSSDQLYIALGMLLSACAVVGIDTCPMEGFDRVGFDQVLQLEKENCTAYVACAIGFRSPADKYSLAAKARLSEAEIILEKK